MKALRDTVRALLLTVLILAGYSVLVYGVLLVAEAVISFIW